MTFQISIDRNSSIPAHEQIKDQVKLALVIGKLRPGDHLPSIRQLDTQLRIGTATIRRAYQELAAADILVLEHGRGVFLKNGILAASESFVKKFEKVCHSVLTELDNANLVPSAFARFFYSKALEGERQSPTVAFVEDSHTLSKDYADQIASSWQIPVAAFSLTELRQLPPAKRAALRRILTTYYHVDEVRAEMHALRAEILPLDVEFNREMYEEIGALAEPAEILFVLVERDYEHQSNFILGVLKDAFPQQQVNFSCVPYAERLLREKITEGKHDLVYVSNRIWDHLGEDMKNIPRVRRPRLNVTQHALKSAWLAVGVI